MIDGPPTAEELEAFAAGELAADDADRVAAALARDPEVAAALEEILQLRAAIGEGGGRVLALGSRSIPRDDLALAAGDPPAAAPSPSPTAPIVALAARRPPRRRLVALGGAALGVAAAAAAVVALRRPAARPGAAAAATIAEVRAALRDHRGLEPRLAWAGADAYRPYDVARAGGLATAEALPLRLLARVEALGDPAALVAAQVLAGNLDQAQAAAARAPATAPDAQSDRAALALVRGDPEAALVAATAALAIAPTHAQARWNRALALAGLGLDRTAADELDAIARAGEPGWAAEARARAAALRAARDRAEATSARIDAAGAALVGGGAVPTAETAELPDRMRLYFYDAVRVATTRARLAELAPMARALDAGGPPVLAGLVDRIAASGIAGRAALAHRYAEVRASRDPAAAASLVRDAQRARAPDIALGAALYTGSVPGLVDPALLSTYDALAAASGDPWFALLAVEQRASARLAADDASAAEAALADGRARCAAAALPVRCQRLARLAVHAYLALHRPGLARAALGDALASARATANVGLERDLLWYAAQVAARRDDVTASWEPVADAYLAEWARQDGTCAAARTVGETRAMALVNRHRIADARGVLADEPACDAPVTLGRLFVLAHVVTAPARIADLRAELAAALAAGGADRAFALHIDGRLALVVDPPAGRARLREAIAAGGGAEASAARTYSYGLLVDDAGARGAWGEAAALLAEEQGLAAPHRCSLGASADRGAVFVAVSAAGATTGARLELDGPDLPAVPPAVASELAGCDEVEVLARGPFHGAPGLLPADRAWHFRVPGARPAAVRAGAGETLVVSGATPPARLQLAPLSAVPDAATTALVGAAATPPRVVAATARASYVEIHAHGVLDADAGDAAFLALSPDDAGRYTLTADMVARTPLPLHPVVVLAACHAAVAGNAYANRWSLADAYIAAGASAVIASPAPIADADAPRFFAGVRARVIGGMAPARALAAERAGWPAARARAWIDALIVFE